MNGEPLSQHLNVVPDLLSVSNTLETQLEAILNESVSCRNSRPHARSKSVQKTIPSVLTRMNEWIIGPVRRKLRSRNTGWARCWCNTREWTRYHLRRSATGHDFFWCFLVLAPLSFLAASWSRSLNLHGISLVNALALTCALAHNLPLTLAFALALALALAIFSVLAITSPSIALTVAITHAPAFTLAPVIAHAPALTCALSLALAVGLANMLQHHIFTLVNPDLALALALTLTLTLTLT